MCERDKVHTRADPCVTRDMLTAKPEYDWLANGPPTELLAWIWGRIEGARGTELPLVKMTTKGTMLMIETSEPLNEDDRAAIKGMWCALWQREPSGVFVHFYTPKLEASDEQSD